MTGLCYRTLGRLEDAKTQFQIALSLSPDLLSAQFNLGLIYQQQMHWQDAIDMFQNVSKYYALVPNAITTDTLLECKIRECDLLQVIHAYQTALVCWKESIEMFPHHAILYHELGDLQAQVCIASHLLS